MKKSMIALAVAMAIPVTAQAALFSNTFDDATTSSAFNVTQIAGSTDVITFGFDYSTRNIAEAPSTPVGAAATRGLFLQANKPAAGAGSINGINVTAAVGGVSINFGGDILVQFDMYLGVGALISSTEIGLFGINTDGVGVNSRTGNVQSGSDGVWYHVANEGGFGTTATAANGRDVVNYIGTSVAGRLDNGQAPFPGLFPNGPLVGAPGNAWVSVVIAEVGGNIVMTMNGVTVFDVANTGPTSGSVFIGYQDPFSGSVPTPAANYFGLFDNVVVSVIPEPSALGVVGLAGMALVRRRRA